MESTTHEVCLTTQREAVGPVPGTKTTVDIWLNANVKATNMAEYQRYRVYLVSGTGLVSGSVSAEKE